MGVTRFADTTVLPRINIQPLPIEITVLNTATCPSPKTSAYTDWSLIRSSDESKLDKDVQFPHVPSSCVKKLLGFISPIYVMAGESTTL